MSCDACGKGGFSGKRFKCLLCYDFDLCSDCHEAGETGSGRHSTSHPMQCILTRVDAGEDPLSLSFGFLLFMEVPLVCPMCLQCTYIHIQKDYVRACTMYACCSVCLSLYYIHTYIAIRSHQEYAKYVWTCV